MNNKNENDTYIEAFMFEIDRCIEYGDCNIMFVAIRKYKNLIDEKYIKMGENIYQELIAEKIQEIII
jgi:hypothetical protein